MPLAAMVLVMGFGTFLRAVFSGSAAIALENMATPPSTPRPLGDPELLLHPQPRRHRGGRRAAADAGLLPPGWPPRRGRRAHPAARGGILGAERPHRERHRVDEATEPIVGRRAHCSRTTLPKDHLARTEPQPFKGPPASRGSPGRAGEEGHSEQSAGCAGGSVGQMREVQSGKRMDFLTGRGRWPVFRRYRVRPGLMDVRGRLVDGSRRWRPRTRPGCQRRLAVGGARWHAISGPRRAVRRTENGSGRAGGGRLAAFDYAARRT
jgi:hypothetical protein